MGESQRPDGRYAYKYKDLNGSSSCKRMDEDTARSILYTTQFTTFAYNDKLKETTKSNDLPKCKNRKSRCGSK